MPIEGEMKLLSAPQVQELAAKAAEHGFSRQVDQGKLQQLDPEKFTLAILLVPAAGGPEATILYHRARLVLRLTGRRDPWRTYLEIADEDWAALPDAEAIRAAVREEEAKT